MSPQLAAFVRFVVEATLRGEGGRIKGYTIAVEALGRGEDFDPQTDPIVRVEAGRLRRALQQYYAGLGATDSVAVDLPPHRTPIQRAVYAGDLVTAFGRRCGATMEAMHDDAGPDLQSIANMGSGR